ncbi:MAG: cation:proton antiporter [Bacteroidota bacterium]
MQHLPPLISDLALILVVAAFTSFLFKWLKQPLVLGYIIAGFLVGPNFNFFPTIVEVEGVKTWAEIGVIFLLFGLGLEFSFKKMLKVGGLALIPAVFGFGFTMLSGYILAYFLGWNSIDSLFMGGVLAISSTTIIIKAYDELGVKNQKFAGLVTGILVIEDIFAVVLMVILSTVAVSQTFEGIDMVVSILKLIFFLVLWFVAGIYFLPSLLKSLKNYMTEESLLILALALCFLMVVLASKAGFSPALGAFIMGSILAETSKAEKIEHTIKPLQNLFGAIFFVSVGMLINPQMMLDYAVPIILATLILLLGKPMFVIAGAIISGEPIKVAVRTGMSLSQIGEFSFIIATMGLALNVTSDFLYPIAVAVSVVTTFTTPYMIKLSGPFYLFVERTIPPSWKKKLDNYSLGAKQVSEESDWKKFLGFYLANTLIFSVVVISIIIISTRFVHGFVEHNAWEHFIVTMSTMLVLLPFLWALAFRTKMKEQLQNIWKKKRERGPLMALLIGRIVLALFFIGFLFNQMYSPLVAFFGVLVTGFIVYLNFYKIRGIYYRRIETQFLSNLNQREQVEGPEHHITPWDSHLATFEIKAGLSFIGKSLNDIQFRENFGINLAKIKRGDISINIPSRFEQVYPNDVLSVIGTDAQLDKFKEYLLEEEMKVVKSEVDTEITLHQLLLENEPCSLVGKSIRNSSIRELTHGLIVGVERDNVRILNPESDFVFQQHDIIWLVGDEKRIRVYFNQILSEK